jgi:DNA-binding transcriptional ArsR family regulator
MPIAGKTAAHATADVFTAIAHPARRQLLDRLSESPRGVAGLAEQFEITRPAISQHLAILLEAGLVGMEKRGREHIYSLQPDRLREVQLWIGQYERFWRDRLDALGAYLDAQESSEDSARNNP